MQKRALGQGAGVGALGRRVVFKATDGVVSLRE